MATKRSIQNVVLHCTGGPQTQTVETIQNYWRNFNGWRNPGYHRLIAANGKIHELAGYEEITNGVKGHNAHSIHISYIGGVDKKGNAVDNRTPAQIASQIKLLLELKELYPEARIVGHRDFLQRGKPGYKACPSFSVTEWLASVPELAELVGS